LWLLQGKNEELSAGHFLLCDSLTGNAAVVTLAAFHRAQVAFESICLSGHLAEDASSATPSQEAVIEFGTSNALFQSNFVAQLAEQPDCPWMEDDHRPTPVAAALHRIVRLRTVTPDLAKC